MKIKEYWNERAEKRGASATTDDVCLRKLEFRTLVKTIKKLDLPDGASILDVGCGDGFTTSKLASAFPQYVFTGFDFSPKMIENAQQYNNVTFVVADIMNMSCFGMFDVIITDRCLINLPKLHKQILAIEQIAKHTRLYYIAIENFIQEHNKMNKARAKVGLSKIPVRWHNNYFNKHVFYENVRKHFDVICVSNFSSTYYFITRVLYAKLCDIFKVTPTHNRLIHKLSIMLLSVGRFSPIVMYVMEKE